jgi:uncharacterized protein (TIGR03000 family)
MLYPAGYGATAPVPAIAPPPVPNGYGMRTRYVDYYTRKVEPSSPSAVVSEGSRYVDYYARKAAPAPPPEAPGTGLYRTVSRTADNKARLQVRVPADAKLWLNGRPTRSTGAEREFLSPELEVGTTYAYEVKARWLRDGRPVEETRQIRVRANKTATVYFGDPPAAGE